MEAPQRKVNAGGLTSQIAAIILWVASLFGHDMPAAVAVSITGVLIYVLMYYLPNPKAKP